MSFILPGQRIKVLIYCDDIVPGDIADDIVDDIVPGDIVDDITEIDHADDSADENEIEDGNTAYESSCSIFHTAMAIRKMLQESKGVGGWLPETV